MVHEKKICPGCGRGIDAFSRLCPFCNYEHHVSRGAGQEPAKIPLTSPPPERRAERRPFEVTPISQRLRQSRLAMIAGAIILLVAAFAVGALVNVLGSRGQIAKAQEEKVIQTEQEKAETGTATTAAPSSDLRLVPFDPRSPAGEPITSAPLPTLDENLPAEAQRTDATALPSTEYSRILASARPTATPEFSSVDPRSLPAGLGGSKSQQPRTSAPRTDRPNAQPLPPDIPAAAAESPRTKAERTRPVPTNQPLPSLDNLKEGGTVRLRLTIGTDGRVKEVQVLQGLEGATGKLIGAVQRWRFKPATLGGEPVEGTFDADISFNASR